MRPGCRSLAGFYYHEQEDHACLYLEKGYLVKGTAEVKGIRYAEHQRETEEGRFV